ncbi:MAG: hypothetical protein ABI960_07410 [Candidatus Eisenbacteria bacterium]
METRAGERSDGFVDEATARRFEALDADYAGRMVTLRAAMTSEGGAEAIVVAGATCAWFASESVLSHVYGLGLSVDATDSDLAAIEEFYRSKGDARLQVELCPFARKSTLRRLGDRGYVVTGFEHVLARPLGGALEAAPPGPGSRITVRAVDASSDEGRAEWSRVAGEAFFAPDLVPRSLEGVFEVTPRLPDTTVFLAEADGFPVAVAALTVAAGIGALFAGATLRSARRAGAHGALLRARLEAAAAAGAEWATAGATPGSGSQHNMERHGFRVAYTRAVLGKVL